MHCPTARDPLLEPDGRRWMLNNGVPVLGMTPVPSDIEPTAPIDTSVEADEDDPTPVG